MRKLAIWIAAIAVGVVPLSAQSTQEGAESSDLPICNIGPYVVFFDWDDDAITRNGSIVIQYAAKAYENCEGAAVYLRGHTDRSGNAAYNLRLSHRRNASVARHLAQLGLPADRMSANAIGEAQPRGNSLDGLQSLDNRRVVITFGPKR